MKRIKLFPLLLCFVVLISFSACKEEEEAPRITDIIQEANSVYINDKKVETVEASLGAFQGKQGDYIEFRFDAEKEINTFFITEKTTSVRQFNIYAEIDGKLTLIYTGKHIFQENIVVDTVTATAIRVEIVNTEIGNDKFIIQGINAYNIQKEN